MFSKSLVIIFCIFSFSSSFAHHSEDENSLLKPVSSSDATDYFVKSCDDIYFNFHNSLKVINESETLTQSEKSKRVNQKSLELAHIDSVCFELIGEALAVSFKNQYL